MRSFVAAIVARLQTSRSQPADLSVSGMPARDDSVSLVGATPRRRAAIDRYPWGRAALDFTGVSFAEHERLAKKVGIAAAAEVLLVMITNECGTDDRKWQEARDLGIPWQEQGWSFLRGFMEDYNAAVAKDLESMEEGAALSSSSDNERTLGLAGSSDGPAREPGVRRGASPPRAAEEPLQADAAPGDVPHGKEEEEPQKTEEPQKGVLTLKLKGGAATVAVKKRTYVGRRWHGREGTHEGRGPAPVAGTKTSHGGRNNT